MTGRAAPSHADFAAALLDPARPPPAALRAWNGIDVGRRFAVHRNNVVVSLVQSLADSFPVVQRLVGDEFFGAMAGVFVRAQPPRSPLLAEYGDVLADWLAGFEPAAVLPYLPDMARLEHARVRAYHAADAPTVDPRTVGSGLHAAVGLDRLRIGIHPSLTVIVSDWAVASLWAAHQHDGDDAVAGVEVDRAESALVLRAGDDVLVLPVAAGDAALIRSLQSAQTLATAVRAATAAAPTATAADPAAARSTSRSAVAADPPRLHHGLAPRRNRRMTSASKTPTPDRARERRAAPTGRVAATLARVDALFGRIPESLIALLARFSIAAVFWSSGQTKVEGFALNVISGEFSFGWPRLSSSAVDLFRDEYRLPLQAPEVAAVMATVGEHALPLLLLLGLGTRLASFGLLLMTAVIQLLVYPGAYATHGVWAAVLLWLMARGGGVLSPRPPDRAAPRRLTAPAARTEVGLAQVCAAPAAAVAWAGLAGFVGLRPTGALPAAPRRAECASAAAAVTKPRLATKWPMTPASTTSSSA